MNGLQKDVKFIVTRNIIIFTCILMGVLTVVNFINGGNNFAIASVAFLSSCALLVLTLKLKSHLIPAIISITVAYCVNFFNLTRGSNFENYIDLFWLINLSLFAYFTLGKTFGKIYLAINMLTILSITILEKIGYIELIPPSFIYDLSAYIDLTLNLTVSTLFFGYLLSQFLIQTEKANKEIYNYNIELNKQYDEKSIMLKEIHHRVKNNLQVITSLLRLQQHKISDKENATPFLESIDRISSMALIHEKMYKGDLIKDIDIKEYIEDLSAILISNYSDNKDIKLQITTDVDSIQLNHIVPFSLIINELISNSLKHAFENRQSGIISLSISKQIKNSNKLKYNELVLHYKDDGVWKAPQNESSFGLELIDTFTDQLDGEYLFNGNKGADYLFTFKEINVNN